MQFDMQFIMQHLKMEVYEMSLGSIVDNGTRIQYGESGGFREAREGKGRQDLIEPELIFRLGRWYELGAHKYGERNWEKGISVKDCIAAIVRHAYKFIEGAKDEDHLAAITWNAAAIMRMEKYSKYKEFLDLPRYQTEKGVDENDRIHTTSGLQ